VKRLMSERKSSRVLDQERPYQLVLGPSYRVTGSSARAEDYAPEVVRFARPSLALLAQQRWRSHGVAVSEVIYCPRTLSSKEAQRLLRGILPEGARYWLEEVEEAAGSDPKSDV
jgi:hypothetical protein